MWYHGSRDVRTLNGGKFVQRYETKQKIKDDLLDQYIELINKLDKVEHNSKEYHAILDKLSSFYEEVKVRRPVFFTNKKSVAKTYADASLAFDYQHAKPSIIRANIKCKKTWYIDVSNKSFRNVELDLVINSLVEMGVSKEKAMRALLSFSYYKVAGTGKFSTNELAAIADYLGFDCIYFIGILDAYDKNNKRYKSDVLAVLDVSNIEII